MAEVRAYQLDFVEQKYSWAHINQVACALRLFYGITLGQREAFERIVTGKAPEKLPPVLNREEIPRFLAAGCGIAQSRCPDDGLCRRLAGWRGRPSQGLPRSTARLELTIARATLREGQLAFVNLRPLLADRVFKLGARAGPTSRRISRTSAVAGHGWTRLGFARPNERATGRNKLRPSPLQANTRSRGRALTFASNGYNQKAPEVASTLLEAFRPVSLSG